MVGLPAYPVVMLDSASKHCRSNGVLLLITERGSAVRKTTPLPWTSCTPFAVLFVTFAENSIAVERSLSITPVPLLASMVAARMTTDDAIPADTPAPGAAVELPRMVLVNASPKPGSPMNAVDENSATPVPKFPVMMLPPIRSARDWKRMTPKRPTGLAGFTPFPEIVLPWTRAIEFCVMCRPLPRLSLMTLGASAKLFVRPMRAVLPPNTNTPLRPFAVNRLFVMTASAPSIIMPSAPLPVTSHMSTVPLVPWKNRMPMPAAMPAPAAETTLQLRSWAWLPVTTMALRPPVTCRPSSTKRSAVTVSVSAVESVHWMPEPDVPLRVTSLLATVTCSKHVPTTSMVSGPRRSASTSLMVLPLPQRTLTFSFLPSSSARAGIGRVVASAASNASRHSTRDLRRVMGAFLRCEEAVHGALPQAAGPEPQMAGAMSAQAENGMYRQ